METWNRSFNRSVSDQTFVKSSSGAEIGVDSLDAGVANEVPRLVFSSVLSGHAQLVDFVAVNKYGRDTFFVVKPHLRQSKEDIKALRRLGPRINLTIHDTQELKGHSMEVKVHLDSTDVLIRYQTWVN